MQKEERKILFGTEQHDKELGVMLETEGSSQLLAVRKVSVSSLIGLRVTDSTS